MPTRITRSSNARKLWGNLMSSLQPVWDFWVRFGHWLITLGVIFQQISGDELELIDAHATVGILLSGWVIFRLVWGFIGPKYARFSSFPLTSPKQVMHSLQRVITKQTEQTPGHTTVGGLAVYLMLILIGLTALSGMASSDDILFAGPLEPFLSSALVDLASQAHPILSKLVLIIVIAHVSAVFWHQCVMKEPLIQGMFHGLKPGFGQSIGQPNPFSKHLLLRGFILFSLCIGGAYGILGIYLGW